MQHIQVQPNLFIIFLFFIIFLCYHHHVYHVILSGVFRPGHPTVSGCFPPPPTTLLLSPPFFSCGGAPPNRGSFDRKDGRSPAEKDGLQVIYHGNRCFTGPPSVRVVFDLTLISLFHSFLPLFLLPRKSLSPGGLGVGKLVLRTGPPRLGDASTRACPETPGTEMLLNGS